MDGEVVVIGPGGKPDFQALRRNSTKLLAKAPDCLHYVEHFDNDPREVMEAACRLGLEGIVSKKADSPI